MSLLQGSERPVGDVKLVHEPIAGENHDIVFLALDVAAVHHEEVTLLQLTGLFEMTLAFSLVDEYSVKSLLVETSKNHQLV